MRILFLSHYFPPEVNAPASRTYEHCRRWVRMGHQVTVVTCAPNHPRGKVYAGYANRPFWRERKDGIDVVRVWTYVTANEGVVKRTLNYVSYMASAVAAAPFLPAADVVLSTSPQFFNGLAGYFVGRLKRAPWVLEIRDLWPESIVAVGAIGNRSVIRTLERLEMFAYRAADRIVPVTDAFERYMVAKGVPADKIEVVKNGVDLDFYSAGEGAEPLLRDLGLDGKFVASYFGTHGMAHHLETVLEAAKLLRERRDIAFLLVGDGAERERLAALRDASGLRNVVMLGQQPKERMPALWRCCGASLVLLRKSPAFEKVIPSKIFESMAMRKPIVLGVDGESRAIVEAARCGLCIEPQSAEALARSVTRLAEEPSLCEALGGNGRRYVAEHFDRDALAARYAALMEGLANHDAAVEHA